MIELRDINDENFASVVAMDYPEMKGKVAYNVYSIAQAWAYRNTEALSSCAVYENDELVGFVMTCADPSQRTLHMWRLMVARSVQGKGIGTRILRHIIDVAGHDPQYDVIKVSYVAGNSVAERIYACSGFVPTGEMDGNEVVMEHNLSQVCR